MYLETLIILLVTGYPWEVQYDVSHGVFNGLYFKMKFEIKFVKLHWQKIYCLGIHVTLL